MVCKGKRRSSVYLAATVFLVCCFAPTIQSYSLKKADRRDGRRDAGAAKTTGVQEGTILFGRVFEKGSAGVNSNVNGGAKQASSNASVEDETSYQADYAAMPMGQMKDASSPEVAWRLMTPSLQCGGDQMKFRAMGPGASQFVLDQGSASPLPLAQVPPTCGYNMRRNSLGLVMVVPYNGCNMIEESGSHVLPMRWQGIPVSLLCPATSAATTTAAPKPLMPQAPWYLPSYPQFPQMPPPHQSPNVQYPKLPPLPQYPTTVAPETTTTTTATTTGKPQIPVFPPYPPYYPPFFQYPPYFSAPPAMTTTPTTTKSTTLDATTAQPATTPHPFLQYPFYPPFFIPPYHMPFPVTQQTTPPTTTPTTTEATTKTESTAQPQPPKLPPFFPPPFFPPFYPPFFPVPPPREPTTPPTTAATTTETTTESTPEVTTKLPAAHFHPHLHPHVHYPPPMPPMPYFPFPV